MALAFTPLYIHFMGIESYGLVGFFITLQAVFFLLDMGLSATVSRELARLSVEADSGGTIRDLVRTLECFYWGIAFLAGVSVFLFSPWIAAYWVNSDHLSLKTIEDAVKLMGLVIAFRMPFGFYSGGLLGLQRQVLFNIARVLVETFRHLGVVLILWLVSPTITAFFVWHGAVSILGTLLMALLLWKCLPGRVKPRVRLDVFRKVWRFAAGMSLITILAGVSAQADKVILSKILSLESFGYYTLASVVAAGPYVFIVPLFAALYPRFTQLVANNDQETLKNVYHLGCQLMTVLVLPLAIVISFFSRDLLQIWTQNEGLSANASPILSLLIIGTSLNGMMNLPFALQFAHGWTKLTIYTYSIAILLLIPALIVTANLYGGVGAASIWVILNIGYIVFGLYFMHRKLLKGELRRWYVSDFVKPGIISLVVVGFFWMTMPVESMEIFRILWIVLAFITSLGAAFLMTSSLRRSLFRMKQEILDGL